MPRIPGRKSNRPQVDVEDVEVASFVMQHEEWVWRRPCVIRDCEHRMGPKTDEPGWAKNWRACDDQHNPAWVALRGRYDEDSPGLACPCHVAEILAR